MRVYPVFLDLADRSCLVVGGGRVGRSKAVSLIDAGATVLIVDPSPPAILKELAAAHTRLMIAARPFLAGDLDGVLLAFACTSDPAVNASVVQEASVRGVLACDAGIASPGRAFRGNEFSTAAILRRGDVCLAVSTGGAAPALAAHVRDRIGNQFGDELEEASALIARLREQLLENVPDAGARRQAMHQVLERGLIDLLAGGARADAAALCDAALDDARAGAADGEGARPRGGARDRTSGSRGGSCTR